MADLARLAGPQQSETNTGYGLLLSGTFDMSVGELTALLADPAAIARDTVLYLNMSSSSDTLPAGVDRAARGG